MSDRGEYRGIHTVLLDGPNYQQLKSPARLMLLTLKLKLGPSGIAVIPAMLPALSELTGMTVLAVTDALGQLEQAGWLKTQGNIAWVINGLKYEPSISSKNANHRMSVMSYLASLPHLEIVDEFRRYYADWLQTDPPPVVDEPVVPANTEPVVIPAKAPPRVRHAKPVPSSWVADGVAWWTENVGTMNHGRFGTALKPLVDKYGWERVFASVQSYVEMTEATKVRIEWFAANGVVLIEKQGRAIKRPAWEQEKYDQGMNNQKAVMEAVEAYKQSLNGSADEWWKKMQREAKALNRYTMVYAYEHLPPR